MGGDDQKKTSITHLPNVKCLSLDAYGRKKQGASLSSVWNGYILWLCMLIILEISGYLRFFHWVGPIQAFLEAVLFGIFPTGSLKDGGPAAFFKTSWGGGSNLMQMYGNFEGFPINIL